MEGTSEAHDFVNALTMRLHSLLHICVWMGTGILRIQEPGDEEVKRLYESYI
jgi:hypothetical protein